MEIIEELKKPLTIEELTRKVLPIAGGMLVVHWAGKTVEEWVSAFVPAEWVTPAAEAALGFGILAANAIVVPPDWKDPVRLAAYTSFGLAILNALKIWGVIGSSSPTKTTKSSVAKKRLTVKAYTGRYL